MSRNDVQWLVAWLVAVGLAVAVGTLLGQFIKSYLEQPLVAVPSVGMQVTPSPSPVTTSVGPSSTTPPVAGPAASAAVAVSSPSPQVAATTATAPLARLTDTPASMDAPAPTPSASPVATGVFAESFADNRAGWPDDPQSTAWLTEGAYHLFARQPGQFVAIPAPLSEWFRDVVITGTFRKVGGPPGGGYGLIVRDQRPRQGAAVSQQGRFYVLEVGDRGEVGIWRREEDRWVDLLPWTRSEAVRPDGAVNEVSVQARGPRLTLRVNGTDVTTAEDSALDMGAVGVFVGGDLNDVVMQRFAVQALP
jgi:hypothetical protein